MNDAVQTRLTASVVFSRSATELHSCVRMMRDIEARLLPAVLLATAQDQDLAANSALQEIDLLVQILEDMALLMTGLAGIDEADTVLQAHYPLSRMRLFDLRQRIAGAEHADADPVKQVSFF
jgi:hypothetical protein